MPAINVAEFPAFLRAYRWTNVNHASRGYPGDTFPDFPWIQSLEGRGVRIVAKGVITACPTDYLREILAWGAGKNDPGMKFEAGLGNVSLIVILQQVVASLEQPLAAIDAALKIPGFGLTYASKLLRFFDPGRYGSLDRRIRLALLKADLLPKIHDSYKSSMIEGYVKFQTLCESLVFELESKGICRPECNLPSAASATGWRIADVEMVLFTWADRGLQTEKGNQFETVNPDI
ncbi:hypothetical protein P5706_34950 [Pseudomonas sp. ChxA]|uniref:hypothetical protein n=1 Tax=Pseudomonas sp. ChxA TaxID=3035473 RepID=UPI0025575AF5|nr:hypothetical protein [Pseudomonas sp. ChxA]MDL2189370.1 hypothetical protein [Pseudomonas sp. ChxA]